MDRDLILIGGLGRSGSTILQSHLAENFSADAVGELKYLWLRGALRNELCGCGLPFSECTYWQDLMRHVSSITDKNPAQVEALRLEVERHRHLVVRELMGLPNRRYREAAGEYQGILAAVYEHLFHQSSANALIDSSKDPAHLLHVIKATPARCHVILIKRDPRAVAYSFSKAKLRPDVHWEPTEFERLDPARVSMLWNFINLAMLAVARKATSSLVLNYEEFCEDQSTVYDYLARIGIGRRDNPSAVTVQHTVSGNPVRLDGTSKPLRVDARWQSEMASRDRLITASLTAPARAYLRLRSQE